MARQYKVWISIEEIDEGQDSYSDYGLPDPLGTFGTLGEAQRLVATIVNQFNPNSAAHSDHCTD